MSVRIRIIIAIVIINLVIVLFSGLMGLSYAKKNLEKSIETDMMVVADIADYYLSTELELLKLQAADVVHNLTKQDQVTWPETLKTLEIQHPRFMGMAVFNDKKELLARAGRTPPPLGLLNNEYIKRAFFGKSAITSTYPTDNGVVFYLSVPIPQEPDHILVVTIPGTYFSEQLSSFVIWKTGHLFINDAKGTVIANIRSEWVENRINFIQMAETDIQYQEIAAVIKQGIQGNTGIGRFSTYGVPRICVYRPITGSEEGWFLGVIAPLPESPILSLNKGLFLVGLIAFFMSIIAAIIASKFIRKPFEALAALKEDAETSLKYKSAYLINMSHGIRTPLNVIIGLTDLLLENPRLEKTIMENLTKISNAGTTLLSIVNDVLDFSKIEAGKLELSPVEYYTSSLLNDIITLAITRLIEKPVSFNLIINDDMPLKLLGDDLRVKQIYTNLLSNAIKYTNEGSIGLSVRCTRHGDSVWMDIIVTDTGIGIREENLKRLFSDYFQVDTKANRNLEGTGLGLSITRRLTELMDGEITAESEFGKGTTFRVRIRQGFAGNTPIGPEIAEKLRNFRYSEDKRIVSKKLVRLNLSYARVLVVDDMQTNLDVAVGLLRKYKMQVDCVLSGQEAVDRMNKGTPVYNAIFMDHMMPGMDGIEAADAIRALETDYAQKIPIIALTANAVQGTEDMFYQHGFQAFISKPVDIMEMDSVIRKWVRNELREEVAVHDMLVFDTPSPQNESEEMKIDIEGVDADKGLALYGGERDIYLPLLRSYAANAPGILDKLRNVSKETLPSYVIAAHGLKGTSAGIGVESIRESALHSETLARAGNLEEVLALNNKLIADTEIIVANILSWLDQYDALNKKPRVKAPDPEVLFRLRQSCENYDMISIDKAMAELESYDYEEGSGFVEWLKDKIAVSEIAEVSERLVRHEKGQVNEQ